MPNAAAHKRAAEYYIGQYHTWVQTFIDAGSKGDLKSAHRFIFHDYQTLQFLEKEFGHDIAREALVHIILDLEQYRAEKLLPIPGKRRKL